MDNLKKLNINKLDIEKSLILKTMYGGSDKTTVFLPNYGDFGPVIHKLIKLVHFFECPKKIICCEKGQESFYPSATSFYTNWENFIEEKYRWGFFTKGKISSIGQNEKYGYYKKKYHEECERIKSDLGNDFNYIHLWPFNIDKVFEKYDELFKFKLFPRTVNNIKVDVAISPRKRESRKGSNFLCWEEIIEKFNKEGYTVGCIGSEEESFKLKNSSANSWDYDDKASASIEMLSNCKLYIGLETGVSHLAGFMSIPTIMFSHANPKLYTPNIAKKITESYFLDLGKNVTDYSLITSAALKYLKGNKIMTQKKNPQIRFTAKEGQDKWALKMLDNKKKGYFVDIGATGGINNNNTYALEKEFEWEGICVEPNPLFRAFPSLIKNRKCICENVCIFSSNGIVDFIARGRHVELSGIHDNFSSTYIQHAIKKGHPTIKVPSITLLDLLQKNNAPKIIDYLSIDTEGSEWEILKGFDFDQHIFLTITIEHNYAKQTDWDNKEKIKRDKIRKLLTSKGYILYKEGSVEDWFIHKSIKNKEIFNEKELYNYKLETHPNNFFDTFVDIGGCSGSISIVMSQKNPKSKIYCYEPSNEDFDNILKNVSDHPNITVINEDLGNGKELFFEKRKTGQHTFSETKGEYSKPSRTLKEIFDANNIDTNNKCGLKIDCEGGERFLIGDKESEEIIKKCEHVAMEIHFKSLKYPWFSSLPEFAVYDKWINDNFSQTHHILYHKSRKRSGCGIYVLTKKKYETKKKFWTGTFDSEIKKYYKISFCTTCMGRLYNLKETLLKNMQDNKDYPNVEFVVLDYNSNDGLGKWIKKKMMKYIKKGRLVYYRTDEPKSFSMAHSRNIAFKVASGEIVNNLDADNFTSHPEKETPECWAAYLNRMANDCSEKVIFAKGKSGMRGRIGFYKKEFIDVLGGYDEDLLGYGHDDHDLVYRAWALDFIMYWWGGKYYNRIKTSRQERNQNMERPWKVTENENKIKSAGNIQLGLFKANRGKHWGKAKLIKNFSTEMEI